jgi:hypothetical protein
MYTATEMRAMAPWRVVKSFSDHYFQAFVSQNAMTTIHIFSPFNFWGLEGVFVIALDTVS